MDNLDKIFHEQGGLQRKYGHIFTQMDGEQLAEYIRWNTLACEDELHEALAEVNWKPWLTTPRGMHDREKYVGELRDAFQFLLNLMLCVGVTPDELTFKMGMKLGQNHRRQDQGYDGRDKCPASGCTRALDEPGTRVYLGDEGEAYCSQACAIRTETH